MVGRGWGYISTWLVSLGSGVSMVVVPPLSQASVSVTRRNLPPTRSAGMLRPSCG